MIAVDTNVLVYAHPRLLVQGSPESAGSQRWLGGLAAMP